MMFFLAALFLVWLLIAVSLFNAILLLWLGVTVFLSAERRSRGLWLILGGMFAGALFFFCHTVIISSELTVISNVNLNFWWFVGWIPVIAAPLLWYVVMLWYAGFWESENNLLRRRHRIPAPALTIYAGVMVLLLYFGNALPSYTDITLLYLSGTRGVGSVPLMLIVYPIFAVICIALSADAMRYPTPARRMMGDLARSRSRPWLMNASLVLLLCVLLLTGFIIWLVYNAYHRVAYVNSAVFFQTVALFDLVMEMLFGAAIIMLGQAVVAYEVFTGKTLPRRGFLRHWRNAIILSSGLAGYIAFSLIYKPTPLYNLMLLASVAVIFYALLSWRSFVHRDYLISRLRPFVSSQKMMEHLVNPQDASDSRARSLFSTVCAEVLNTQEACLIPMGTLSSLVGAPLMYPPEKPFRHVPLSSRLFSGNRDSIVSLDAETFDGFLWAIPLWAERGLTGALMLGARYGDSLYTQEEIDIARAAAERIIDMLAGEHMARRLMALQRKRHATTRVIDLSTRRTLHDEVLPALHMAILQLNAAQENAAVKNAMDTLVETHTRISNLIHTPQQSAFDFAPGSSLTESLRGLIESEFKNAFHHIDWNLQASAPEFDELTQEVILHAAREAVRNAAVHARGDTTDRLLNMCIESRRSDDEFSLCIVDDGVGLNYASGGGGSGLALHSTMLAIVGGYLIVEPEPERGTRVEIRVPVVESAARSKT